MRACSPLVCRDPTVFVKAFATSVKIDSDSAISSSTSYVPHVILLCYEERVRNMKLLGLQFVRNVTDACANEKHAIQADQSGRIIKGRGKSPHQLSTSKSPAKSVPKLHFQVNGTPANHISLILLNEIMSEPDVGAKVESFLKPADYLDILSDLVLAIPACGAAVLRYKPKQEFCNAISGCPNPPQTAVSYVLHKLLPLPRLIPKETLDSRSITKIYKVPRLQAFTRTKICQAGARLIVCLMARSGDGRRCVVSELVFALSCRSLTKPKNTSEREPSCRDAEMWAISTWGDLVYSLSAPRCNNNSLISQDLNSTLSFGVVKLMMEHGITHALMAAIERIDLHQ